MIFGFSYIGLIWLIMLTVPNLIWTKNQPKDYEKYSSNENKILLAFERCGQVIVTTTALIFSDFNFKGFNFWVAGATLPVIAFFLLGIYGGNIVMLVGTIVLGIGHIGIHLQHEKDWNDRSGNWSHRNPPAA